MIVGVKRSKPFSYFERAAVMKKKKPRTEGARGDFLGTGLRDVRVLGEPLVHEGK